jgi:hypothetical protein
MSAARMSIMCNVLACLLIMALRIYGGEEEQMQPATAPAAPAVSQKDGDDFAMMRMMAVMSQFNPITTVSTNSALNAKKKVASASEPEKKKTSKPKKTHAKKADSKQPSSSAGLISWLWTDIPGAPSVRGPKNGSGNWPKFK